MEGQRTDARLALHLTNGRPLAQQNFQQIDALFIATELRHDDANATRQRMCQANFNDHRNCHGVTAESSDFGACSIGAGGATAALRFR